MKIFKSITFLMLQLKMGGGNRVFFELAKRGVGKIKVVTTKTKHFTDFDINQFDCVKIGNESRILLLRLLSYVELFFFVLINRHKLGLIVYSDPLLAPIIVFSGCRKYIRFLQADDLNLFNSRRSIPALFRYAYKVLTRYAYRRERFIICNSFYTYDCYKRVGGAGKLLGIVNPGIDTTVYNMKNRGYRSVDFAILARQGKLKGLDTFVNALKIFLKENTNRIYKVLLFANKKPNMFDEVLSNADFLLARNDIENSAILNNSRFFIYPSRNEGFGLPPLEAMACGCVVIASDCGGVREYGIDNKNIIYFKAGDFKDLAKKMMYVIANNVEEIRKNGTETAKKMTWEVTYKSFLACLKKVNIYM